MFSVVPVGACIFESDLETVYKEMEVGTLRVVRRYKR